MGGHSSDSLVFVIDRWLFTGDVFGAGTVGLCAARAFQGLGAHLTILDNDLSALQRVQDTLPNIVTLMSSPSSVARSVAYADVVVSTVMIPGHRASEDGAGQPDQQRTSADLSEATHEVGC